jgi:hypothetical protein
MATRFDQPVVRRPPLPLTAKDEQDLARLRAGTPEREALARLMDGRLPADVSESLLLHALLEVAMQRVREEAERVGYAELAEQRAASAADDRSAARRRAPSWAAEA